MRSGARAAVRAGRSRPRPLVVAALLTGIALGCAKEQEPPAPTRVRWTYHTQPISYASPALSLDGKTVYFGTAWWETATPTGGQSLHALATATGAVRWSYALGTSEVRSAPAVGPDDSISFVVETRGGALKDALHRLSSSGELLWTYDVNPTSAGLMVGLSAPAIGTDGTVYVAGDQLYAISSTGQLRWTRARPIYDEALHASPVIGSDGTVYFAAHNVPLTAFDPDDGTTRWTRTLGAGLYVFASPAIGADGTLYVGDDGGTLWAVSRAGELLWQYPIGSAGYSGSIRASPAVGADGTIYFGITEGSPANAIFAVTPAGALRWTFVPADVPADLVGHADMNSSPALGASGAVYFGNEFGRVYAVDAKDGTQLWKVGTAQGIGWPSPALAADGTLFVGDIGGGCYAITTGDGGLDPAAAWPKYRGDAQNSGRKP